MLMKSFAVGFVGASAVMVLAVVVWLGTEVKEERGLVWGDRVYTYHRDFNGYLKPKGLSYKNWAARHPGAARWDRTKLVVGPFSLQASTDTREAWLARLPLVGGGLLFAIGGTLLVVFLVSRFRDRLRRAAGRRKRFRESPQA